MGEKGRLCSYARRLAGPNCFAPRQRSRQISTDCTSCRVAGRQEVPTAASIGERRKHSVEGLLEAGFKPEELAELVIYIEIGLKGGLWSTGYGDKSDDHRRRGPEHAAAHAQWQIIGLHLAPLHYQQAGDCEERLTFPYLQISDRISPAAQAQGLSVYEWAVCWGLGLHALKQDVVAQRDLAALVGDRSVNGTSCPNEALARERRQVAMKAWACRRLVPQVPSGDTHKYDMLSCTEPYGTVRGGWQC